MTDHKLVDASAFLNLDYREVPNLVSGKWITSGEPIEVKQKFRAETVARTYAASRGQIERAIEAATEQLRAGILPGHIRHGVLYRAAGWLRNHKEVIGRIIAQESGKELAQSISEVERTAHTLELSAEYGRAIVGEMVPMDASPGFESATAMTFRVPIGLVCAITPFNSPLNLVAHKVGPAIGAGNAVVVKPSELTPTPAAILAEALLRAGLPERLLHILNGTGEDVGQYLLEHPAFDMYSFTGSAKVGLHIRTTVGMRKVALELGNNSATIVDADAEILKAADACARQAFSNSGQVCISVQRIYVHESIADKFLKELVSVTKSLTIGDPEDEAVNVGPVISEAAAQRALTLIESATASGAQILTGGELSGNCISPTILLEPNREHPVVSEEVFAPIVSVMKFSDLNRVIEEINEGIYGLQTGIFTSNIESAFKAIHGLRMGGVIVNGTSRYRADVMPYGGIKASGSGREGPKFAVEEMTEQKLVVFNLAETPYTAGRATASTIHESLAKGS